MEGKEVKCPKCGAENPIYRKKSNTYICRNEDYEHEFELEIKSGSKKIFISYGHDEYEELASKIKKDLEDLGHEVWFDRSKLKAGRDWEIALEKLRCELRKNKKPMFEWKPSIARKSKKLLIKILNSSKHLTNK